jgi:hypothetical protein
VGQQLEGVAERQAVEGFEEPDGADLEGRDERAAMFPERLPRQRGRAP